MKSRAVARAVRELRQRSPIPASPSVEDVMLGSCVSVALLSLSGGGLAVLRIGAIPVALLATLVLAYALGAFLTGLNEPAVAASLLIGDVLMLLAYFLCGWRLEARARAR